MGLTYLKKLEIYNPLVKRIIIPLEKNQSKKTFSLLPNTLIKNHNNILLFLKGYYESDFYFKEVVLVKYYNPLWSKFELTLWKFLIAYLGLNYTTQGNILILSGFKEDMALAIIYRNAIFKNLEIANIHSKRRFIRNKKKLQKSNSQTSVAHYNKYSKVFRNKKRREYLLLFKYLLDITPKSIKKVNQNKIPFICQALEKL